MKRYRPTFVLLTALAELTLPTLAAQLTPVDSRLAPDLFVWTDTCNVYVLRNGGAALDDERAAFVTGITVSVDGGFLVSSGV